MLDLVPPLQRVWTPGKMLHKRMILALTSCILALLRAAIEALLVAGTSDSLLVTEGCELVYCGSGACGLQSLATVTAVGWL